MERWGARGRLRRWVTRMEWASSVEVLAVVAAELKGEMGKLVVDGDTKEGKHTGFDR